MICYHSFLIHKPSMSGMIIDRSCTPGAFILPPQWTVKYGEDEGGHRSLGGERRPPHRQRECRHWHNDASSRLSPRHRKKSAGDLGEQARRSAMLTSLHFTVFCETSTLNVHRVHLSTMFQPCLILFGRADKVHDVRLVWFRLEALGRTRHQFGLVVSDTNRGIFFARKTRDRTRGFHVRECLKRDIRQPLITAV